jgi:hypothetical protein
MRSSNKNCSSSRGWWWQQATLRLVYACCAGDAAFVPLDLGRESSAAGAVGVGPYYLLRPETFASQLGSDLSWASENIPLFESSNKTLDRVYYFRWRTYKTHIYPTGRSDNISHVVTEFSPNVSWAGRYNTINCAAGHHMREGGWLRQRVYIDSYSRWWVSNEAKHNYYYWFATALLGNFERSGDVELLKEVVPRYKLQFAEYASGHLPAPGHGAAFSTEHDCLWNSPGNEGQEASISGPGCRSLIQSMMYGEAIALSRLLSAIGDSDGAAEMDAEAHKWQRRVLRLWNNNITGFDTLRMPPPWVHPPPPPCADFTTKSNCPTTRCHWQSGKCGPPPPPPAPPFSSYGWHWLAGRNGTECLPRSYIWQGSCPPSECIFKCAANAACKFATIEFYPPSRPGGGYCNLVAGNCSTFNGWDNQNCTLPLPGCLPQTNETSHIATFAKPPPAARTGYELLPTHNGTFCCDQTQCKDGKSTFLHQGSDSDNACFATCSLNPKCKFVTWHPHGASAGSQPWCFNAEYCNTTNSYDGKAGAPTPAEMAFVHTWRKQQRSYPMAQTTVTPPAFAGVRELASLSSPWYFGAVPDANASLYATSWNTAFDPDGLGGDFGLRTAERRHPKYFCDKPRPGPGGGCCSWSGPVWPVSGMNFPSLCVSGCEVN